MKRIKISMAALAFVLTAGLAYASNAATTAPNDCAVQPGSPTGDYNSDLCQASSNICCYIVGTSTPFKLGDRQ